MHDIFLFSTQNDLNSLVISQKDFIKSFSARVRSVRDILEFGKSLNDSCVLNSEEALRIVLLIKFFIPLPKQSFFVFVKRSGLFAFSNNFSVYHACFFNLLFLSYLPFGEVRKDPFMNNFQVEVRDSVKVLALDKYIGNLSFLYPEVSIVSSFDLCQKFTLKSVNWLLKNFPFNRIWLRSYLYSFALDKRFYIYSDEFFLFFDYNKFDLFLFSFITNGLLCF